jgi:1-deoxy-D-xylulose 5-phosphate reductoisomerase
MQDLDILIHPEALVHSIIEYNDSTSIFNYFYNDMSIPILNFLNHITNKKLKKINKFKINKNFKLNFIEVDKNKFPIYNIFKNIEYKIPQQVIKFNAANQYAVELFQKNMIKYIQMPKIIEKSLSYELNASINSIGSIINYEKEFNKIMKRDYEKN